MSSRITPIPQKRGHRERFTFRAHDGRWLLYLDGVIVERWPEKKWSRPGLSAYVAVMNEALSYVEHIETDEIRAVAADLRGLRTSGNYLVDGDRLAERLESAVFATPNPDGGTDA